MNGLRARHRRVPPGRPALHHGDPPEAAHGEGRYVRGARRRTHPGSLGGLPAATTAHALPGATGAVTGQAGRIIRSPAPHLNRPVVEPTEPTRPIDQSSGVPGARAFFTASGTGAGGTALLLATAHRRSNTVRAARNGHHGRSSRTAGPTGDRGRSQAAGGSTATGPRGRTGR
ncbi:hypothetical protein QQY24_05760 [Streptomyces sp. TG1A-8]|uniref:hypothetical protein n=1 Tax=Streptomyces sp. TG1A-8 TaxID=3051385 RepID=UPI00265C799E|nr:hypothetical protein [Streptomyces sp. TG1A-8]MDO0924946.1 hypothetical protein [Streptomyces sp. TG1A-8]